MSRITHIMETEEQRDQGPGEENYEIECIEIECVKIEGKIFLVTQWTRPV